MSQQPAKPRPDPQDEPLRKKQSGVQRVGEAPVIAERPPESNPFPKGLDQDLIATLPENEAPGTDRETLIAPAPADDVRDTLPAPPPRDED